MPKMTASRFSERSSVSAPGQLAPKLLPRRVVGNLCLFALAALWSCESSGHHDPLKDRVVEFVVEVEGKETFRIRLVDSVLIAQGQQLMETHSPVTVSGYLQAGNGGFNSPFSWHLDPMTVSFSKPSRDEAEVLPSQVDKIPGSRRAGSPTFRSREARIVRRED